jgi:hypothetical protein
VAITHSLSTAILLKIIGLATGGDQKVSSIECTGDIMLFFETLSLIYDFFLFRLIAAIFLAILGQYCTPVPDSAAAR